MFNSPVFPFLKLFLRKSCASAGVNLGYRGIEVFFNENRCYAFRCRAWDVAFPNKLRQLSKKKEKQLTVWLKWSVLSTSKYVFIAVIIASISMTSAMLPIYSHLLLNLLCFRLRAGFCKALGRETYL